MSEREKTQFLRRTLCLGVFQLSLLIILLGRLYIFQILEGNHYHILAEGNRIATRPLIPPRGQLYDRHGKPLAQNIPSFRLVLLTTNKDKVKETLETLSRLIPLSAVEKRETLEAIRKKRGLGSIILKDSLTWEQVSVLELHATDLPGLSIEVGAVRSYPEASHGANLLGYVGSPSEEEQDADPLLSLPELKVGKGGFEKYFDSRLRGTPGYRAFEVNAKRKVVRELHQIPPRAGEAIHTTLDAALQAYVQEILDLQRSASAVVIEIDTGDVLALASSPSFDPNLFSTGISHKNWNALRDNPYMPLTNKAISGLYPPGSTLKPFVALAALKSGVIDKTTKIHCPGHIYVGDHKFHCMHIHGSVDLAQALAKSCDVFFYEIAKRLGIDRMVEVFQDLGFGSGGIEDFPYRKKGLVPTKAWKMERKHAPWTISDSIQTSIGQGYMLTTPLELAVAIARLASGKRIVPRFEKKGTVQFPLLSYDKHFLDTILDSLNDTVNVPGSTAFGARIPFEGMEMGGKTGTSQVRRITLQQRAAGQTKTHGLDWQYREHGLFIAYAPIHAPRYAIAVVVEHAGGSGEAARLARDILIKVQLLEKNNISPQHEGR